VSISLLWRNCDKKYIDLGEKDHSKIGTVVGNEPSNMIQQTFAKEQGLKKRFLFIFGDRCDRLLESVDFQGVWLREFGVVTCLDCTGT